MKKLILVAVILFIANFQIKAQSTVVDILNAMTNSLNQANEQNKSSLKNLVYKKIVVNSASKANFGNGKTRAVVQVELPKGTTEWYYRITVLDVNSAYSYQENEAFYYLLLNHKNMENYSPTDDGINFYLLGHSGDVASFLQTGNNDFKYFTNATRKGTRSFCSSSKILNENLWIGILNPNYATGLKVIVEIVSWGHYQ